MLHFDEIVYKADPSTLLYKIVDALCGTAGAGALINEILLARMGSAMETIYFNELDYIFGKVSFISRSPAESYTYNPLTDLLTADQWDEVRIKDAWYRERIREFFTAATKGSTPEGIRAMTHAAIGVDADIFEVWRYADSLGILGDLGRAEYTARNEIVIRPHKDELSQGEIRLLRDMLTRTMAIDRIITVSTQGLAVATPVPIASATADSTYFEVQKVVTSTPVLDQLPPPELLPIDLIPSEQWMFTKDPAVAPYAAFNITQESSSYYLMSGGSRSPIDSVTYGTLQPDGSVMNEADFETFESTGQHTGWISYERADSPDNFPGGKYGLNPSTAPALNPDGSSYIFPFASQLDYVSAKSAEVLRLGGIADDVHYKLPIQNDNQTRRSYKAEYAVAYAAPARDSTVSSSLTRRRPLTALLELRSPGIFARTTT